MSIERIVEEIKEKTEKKEYWDFKGKDNRDHVHAMLKYPAVMVPNMQGEIFDILLKNDKTIHNVLDPFMGSGTILVEGMIRGLDVCGVDINPLSYLLVLVKTQNYSLGILQKKSKELIERINKDEIKECFSFEGINKWYNDEIIVQLSRIRRCIIQEPDIKYRRLFWVTFAEIAKQSDNSRTSTFKLHIKEKEDIDNWDYDCVEKFRFKLLENITAIKDFSDLVKKRPHVAIKYGDSLRLLADRRVFKNKSYDLVITSPPYGDNATTITYGQYSVLPLRWMPLTDIGDKISEEAINTLTKIDNDSLGGHYYTVPDITKSELYDYSDVFHSLYNHLTDEMQIEKARKVASFLLDIEKIVSSLSEIVNEHKYMVFTVGNRHVNKEEVPFDEIISDISEHYGFDVLYDFKRNILKSKVYTDTKAQNFKTIQKETVIVLKKRGNKNGS